MKKKLLLILYIFIFTYIYSNSFVGFKYNGRFGLLDNNLDIVTEPVYKFISCGNYIYTKTPEDIFSIYDTDLNLIYKSDVKCNNHYYSENEIILSLQNGKEYYLLNLSDKSLKKIDFFNFDIKSRWKDKRCVKLDSKNSDFYVIDNMGNVIIDGLKECAAIYSDGLLAVILEDGTSGFIDVNGKLIFETPFYFNKDEEFRRSPLLIYGFSEGQVLVQQTKGEWVVFDECGQNKKFLENYNLATFKFCEGSIVVKKTVNGRTFYGYMNKNLENYIPCIFSSASAFENGCAQVVYKEKDALLFKDGRLYFCEDLIKENKTFIKIDEDFKGR